MTSARLDLLTDTQKDLLRFVQDGLTSKEIAQRLGGSHHTVNADIAAAVRLLGLRSRMQAAALLAARDAGGSYEPSYEPAAIVDGAAMVLPPAQGKGPETGFPLPIPTSGRPTNTLTIWQKALWIFALAVILALLAGGISAQLWAISQHLR
jgi:DNA-binding CsgD family transcriptional regulator